VISKPASYGTWQSMTLETLQNVHSLRLPGNNAAKEMSTLIMQSKEDWSNGSSLPEPLSKLLIQMHDYTSRMTKRNSKKSIFPSPSIETIDTGVPIVLDLQSEIISTEFQTYCDSFLQDGYIDVTVDDSNSFITAYTATCLIRDVAGNICGQSGLGFNVATACVIGTLLCDAGQFLYSQLGLCQQLQINNRMNAAYRRALFALENQYVEAQYHTNIQTTFNQLSSTNSGSSSSVATKELKRVSLEVVPYRPGVAFIVAGFVDFVPEQLVSLCLIRYSNNTQLTLPELNGQECTSSGFLPIFGNGATVFTLPTSGQYDCLKGGSWETMVLWDGTTGKGQTWVNLCST